MASSFQKLVGVPGRTARWLFVALLFLAVGLRAVTQAGYFRSELTDFNVYYDAAVSLTAGHDPYRIVTERGWHFISPLLTAVVFVPLTSFPVIVAAAIWYVISVALLVATVYLALSRLLSVPSVLSVVNQFTTEGTEGTEIGVWAVPLLILAGSIIVTLCRGQWFLLVGFLIVLGWWCHDAGHGPASGFLFGLAAALKVLPFLFLPYLLLKRRWSAVIGFVAAIAFGFVFLPGAFVRWRDLPRLHQEWLHIVVYPALNGSPSIVSGELLDLRLKRNQSTAAVTYRVLSHFGNPAAAASSARTIALQPKTESPVQRKRMYLACLIG